MKGILYFDGSAAPTNPGMCTAGAVLLIGDSNKQYSQLLGQGTSNSAEYGGLILGLTKAIEEGVTEIEIYGDSKLVVMCVRGDWGSKQAHLTLCIGYARVLLHQFESWSLTHIPREENIADPATRVNTHAVALKPIKLVNKRVDKANKCMVRL